MLFDLTFPCYLTTFSGKKCLSGKVICAFFVPLIKVLLYKNPDGISSPVVTVLLKYAPEQHTLAELHPDGSLFNSPTLHHALQMALDLAVDNSLVNRRMRSLSDLSRARTDVE
jgi:hypothetical protein